MVTLERELRAGVAFLDRHINIEATAGRVDGLSLETMRSLMRSLGDPQLDVPVIQVTGTNGKGSTSAMITSLLAGMGLSVGTYGSPHVSSIRERISRNGELIEAVELAEVLASLEAAESTLDVVPSWFELMTAAAYRWFADQAVDVAVVEVGKLGRFDATSVTQPVVAVITNVGYDHTDGGRGWRRDIAWEKAGIIAPSSIVCLGEVDPELDEVFAAEPHRELRRRGSEFDCEDNEVAVGGRLVTLRTTDSRHEDLFVSLHGPHQGDNAAIALAAAEAFIGTGIPFDIAEEAMGKVHLPGRFEILGREPLIVVDGAHNPAGAEAAVETLDDGFSVMGRRILVVGMMNERDPEWMLSSLAADRADIVIVCTAPSPRGRPASELAAVARAMDLEVEAVDDPAQAIARARSLAADDDLIFVAGSLYVAGAVRDALLAS